MSPTLNDELLEVLNNEIIEELLKQEVKNVTEEEIVAIQAVATNPWDSVNLLTLRRMYGGKLPCEKSPDVVIKDSVQTN